MKQKKQPRPYRMRARAEAAAQTHQRIIEAATALVGERNLDDVSLADVAERAGVTVQTVLRRFGSKDGLVDASVRVGTEAVRAQRFAAPQGDLDAALAALAGHYEAWGDRSVHFLAQAERSDAMRKLTDGGRALHHEWVDHTFRPQLAARRDAADRRRLRAQLIAVTDVSCWKILRRDLGLDAKETARSLRELVDAVLR